MKCDLTRKVSLLIDGELPQAEAREVERHLDLCGDCQSAREDFLMLRRQLADYPLELDAFARQRALKRILAAGGNNTAAPGNETATPTTRRERFAGVFGMPRLSPAGLAALLLLLVGVAVGVVSLMSSRRAPVEIVSHVPTPPTAHANNGNNGSSAATPNTPPSAPVDLTASANKTGGEKMPRVESAGGRVPGRSSTPPNLNRRRVGVRVAEAARNDSEAVGGGVTASGANDAGDRDAARREAEMAKVTEAADAAGSKTARHVEQAQLLLRSFRNSRPADAGGRASSDLAYEKQRSKKLLYENIVLRREAASRGNLPVESLLDSLEPILIDIANLPDKPAPADVREINERMRRKNLVAMLQISAVESASARSY